MNQSLYIAQVKCVWNWSCESVEINRSQKFEDPAEGEAALVAKFKKLYEDLNAGFRALEDETR